MKQLISTLSAILITTMVLAQSTNPLNYSGKMYVTTIDVLSTPRYVSFEDHAILSTEMTLPVTEVTKILFDFEKNKITIDGQEHNIKVTATKKYTMADGSWTIVIYINFLDEADKYELVYREYGNPYFQEITKTDNGVKIARTNLSTKPSAASPYDALLQLLGSYEGL